MKNENIKTIGIFGHYGNLNLGDEAIITAVIENIKQRYSDAQLFCFSINPQDTESRYGITSFPIRPLVNNNEHVSAENHETHQMSPAVEKLDDDDNVGIKGRIVESVKKIPFVVSTVNAIRALPELIKDIPNQIAFSRKSFKTLKSVDLLIIAGSNQFLDNFGGPWGFPYTLLRWSVLAKLARVKISYISVGAGPLEAKTSRFLCRSALRFADYVSFRDVASQEMIVRQNKNGHTSVYPDLAFSLVNRNQSTNGSQNNKLIVGINVMAIYDPRYWCEPDGGKYAAYINNLATFADKLMQDNVEPFFFGTQKKDEAVIVDALRVLGEKRNAELSSERYAKYSDSVYGLLDVIAEADVIVATRFHGTVLSLFSRKPTLGVCYYRKSADLLKAMGQGDYYVNVDDFDPEELYKKFKQLVSNKNREIEKLESVASEYQQVLDHQYDAVLA